MLGIGPWEIAIIVVIALLLIGPRRLPEVMKSVGKGLFELRKASSDFRRTLEHEVHMEERKEQDDRVMAERRKYMEQLKEQQAAEVEGQTNGEAGDTGGDDAANASAASDASGEPAPAEAAVPDEVPAKAKS